MYSRLGCPKIKDSSGGGTCWQFTLFKEAYYLDEMWTWMCELAVLIHLRLITLPYCIHTIFFSVVLILTIELVTNVIQLSNGHKKCVVSTGTTHDGSGLWPVLILTIMHRSTHKRQVEWNASHKSLWEKTFPFCATSEEMSSRFISECHRGKENKFNLNGRCEYPKYSHTNISMSHIRFHLFIWANISIIW